MEMQQQSFAYFTSKWGTRLNGGKYDTLSAPLIPNSLLLPHGRVMLLASSIHPNFVLCR